MPLEAAKNYELAKHGAMGLSNICARSIWQILQQTVIKDVRHMPTPQWDVELVIHIDLCRLNGKEKESVPNSSQLTHGVC